MTSLFNDLDVTSARIPTVTSGQQDLLVVINRLSGESGEWTGPRSVLSTELGCSVDTVTRRKDALVEAGLLEVTPFGRSLRYRMINNSIASLPRVSGSGAPTPTVPGASARRWWQRPDANQLDLFEPVRTRQEARAALKAATLHWIGLIVCAVFGPATTPAASTAASPATSETASQPAAITTTEPAAQAANVHVLMEKPNAQAANDHACDSPIEPTPIPTEPTVPQAQLQRSIEPMQNRSLQNCLGEDAEKWCLWKDAKDSDFLDPRKIRQLYEMLLKFGLCTPDEELLVFTAVANKVRLKKSRDNLPGIITAIFRGAGKTPWRALGSAADRRKAAEQIRSLDVPIEMQRRSSDLDEESRRVNHDAKLAAARARAKEYGHDPKES